MLSESNYNALKKYKTEYYTGSSMTDEIRYFLDYNYIRVSSRELKGSGGKYCANPTAWIITPLGEDALSEFEYVRSKDAQEERQKRFDRKIAILNILVPLITFIAGLLVEYFCAVSDFVISLFH